MGDEDLSLIDAAIRYAGSDSGRAFREALRSKLRRLRQLESLSVPFGVTADEMSNAWHDTHDREGQEPTREALNAILANRKATP